jgi:uncharacterized phage-associated protein
MPVGSLRAAKRLCELSGWTVSNLEINKLLYIAHMFYLGRGQGPLVSDSFEAWDYGPVLPRVYHRAKAFGGGPVRNVFHDIPEMAAGPEADMLEEAYSNLKDARPGHLVNITHWDEGAWAQHYHPGGRHIVIPDSDILDEFRRRAAKAA